MRAMFFEKASMSSCWGGGPASGGPAARRASGCGGSAGRASARSLAGSLAALAGALARAPAERAGLALRGFLLVATVGAGGTGKDVNLCILCGLKSRFGHI